MSAGSEADLVKAAVMKFVRQRPYLGCHHVVRDRAGAQLCSQHPAAGLLCIRCAARHVRRHDRVEELVCDVCHSLVEAIHPRVATTRLSGGPVRDPKGHWRMFDAQVAVIGTGRCGTCLRADSVEPSPDMLAELAEWGWTP